MLKLLIYYSYLLGYYIFVVILSSFQFFLEFIIKYIIYLLKNKIFVYNIKDGSKIQERRIKKTTR